MKFYFFFILTLFFIACNDNKNQEELSTETNSTTITNDSNEEVYSDFFELESSRFRVLNIEHNDSLDNRYSITNLGASLIAPKDMKILDDESKKIFIEKADYSKKFEITVDDIFMDNNSGFALIVGSIQKDKNSLDSLIKNMKSFSSLDEYSEKYYIINNKKAIQFRVLLSDTYLLRIVFNDNSNGYLVLDYLFQKNSIENSLPKTLDSMSSVTFN